MPGASASGLGVGCGAFSSPCIPSCPEGSDVDGCDDGRCGDSGTCAGVSSVSSSDIRVVFAGGVNDAP